MRLGLDIFGPRARRSPDEDEVTGVNSLTVFGVITHLLHNNLVYIFSHLFPPSFFY